MKSLRPRFVISRRVVRGASLAMLGLTLQLSLAATASAHPLGNFTINVYDGLTVAADRAYIDHVVDMAELPAVEARNAIDVNSDGTLSDDESASWAQQTCTSYAGELQLTVGGAAGSAHLTDVGVSFPPGQAGLTTLRLVCGYETEYPSAAPSTAVAFSDRTFAGHQGWREIVVGAAGTTLAGADAYASGASDRLRSYPVAAGGAIRAQTQAAFTLSPIPGASVTETPTIIDAAPVGSPAALVVRAADGGAAVPGGVTDLPAQLTEIVQAKDLSVPAVLLSLLLALFIGGLHAASPGHGKTLMAAYLVGSRGTVRHALALGLTVTISHTIGVLALGVLVVLAGAALPAAQLFPVLGLVSGLIVMTLGALFLGQRIVASRHAAHAHAHDHGEHGEHSAHDEGDHPHAHPHETDTDGWHAHGPIRHTHLPPATMPLRTRNLVALGLVGGLVPSASAILLLVGSIAAGRPAYGIILTITFGIGMATVLVGVGVLLVRARSLIERLPSTGMTRIVGYAPLITALIFVIVGAAITFEAGVQLT